MQMNPLYQTLIISKAYLCDIKALITLI